MRNMTQRGLTRRREGVNRLADFRRRLDSANAWNGLAHRLVTSSTSRTSTVKFLIDLERDDTYFMNSQRWLLHHEFVRRFIDPTRELVEFNRTEYTSDHRRFVLGSLLHYGDGDVWTLELDVSDTLDADRVRATFEHIASRVHFGNELRFRPRSSHFEAVAASLEPGIESMSGDDLNANVRYQPVVTGTAFGYVRCVSGPVDPSTFSPNDIVVLDHVPAEIPPVAALVTGELQAPLAHVAVLCRNRDTPDMALRDATENSSLTSLDGQLVRLDIGQQEFTIDPADVDDANTAWESVRPPSPTIPSRDLSTDALCELAELVPSNASFAGSKAARLAEISDLPSVRTTGGFVVPFAWYDRHLSKSGAVESISALHAAAGELTTPERHERLAEIRAQIIDAEPDGALLDELMVRLASTSGPHILRSSTNAEDLEGFNGAGLYDSIVVADTTDRDEVARVLRTVWSSVWSNRGVEEREWYRIDHDQVSMAVLVQPVVPAMDAIGVAVTHNPFNTGLSGQFINVQRGSASVTDAAGDELPEQILVHTWADQPEVEVLSRATGADGVAIMSDPEVLELSEILRQIDEQVVGPGAESMASDVEFALGGGADRIVILQARPYRIEAGDERTLWDSNATFARRVELAARSRGFRLMQRFRQRGQR